MAASEGHLDIVQLLVHNGADVDSKNLYGHTAVMLAIENGQIQVAQWLLRRNPAGLLIENKYGKTPFFVAAEFAKESHTMILKWILTDFRNENSAENVPLVDEVSIRRPRMAKRPFSLFANMKNLVLTC